jgi:ATP-binding protein involved in chromosome partitioning
VHQDYKDQVIYEAYKKKEKLCPNCGHEAHLFGHGGVADEAKRQDLPFLGELPLSIDVRLAGDAGTPIAAGDGPEAAAYARLAHRLIAGGMA